MHKYILYIYKIRFPNVGGGGGEQHVRPPMCESDFMFFQVKFFPLLICFSIGVGGGGWTTCTAAHVWEWLCVFLSEILSSLLRRRSKIKPHKLLLFIMWNYASFFLFRFFVLLFFFFFVRSFYNSLFIFTINLLKILSSQFYIEVLSSSLFF